MQIGVSNLITRVRERTKLRDTTIDARPEKFASLLDSCRRAMQGKDLFMNDAVIHGVRARCITDSFHLADFWKENWFSPLEWQRETGVRTPDEPQVTAYAFTKVSEEPEAAYYSRKNNTIIVFNTAYYGQLKSWTLGAIGRLLAEELGIHSIRGAAVQREGKGALFIGPTGAGKSTSAYGLMDSPGVRLHSDDGVFVRYGFRRLSGQVVCPVSAGPAKGYAVFRWLETNKDPSAKVLVHSLDHERFELNAGDLEFDSLGAYAFISEKKFYVRTNLVESAPQAFEAFLKSKLENVPQVSPDLLASQAPLLPSGDMRTRESFLRLYAFDNSRAMLSPAGLFGRERVFTNPMEPLKLDAVFLLRRQADDDSVAESVSLDRFCSRLMGAPEIACNATRTVDERAEADYVQMLEAVRRRTNAESIWQVHEGIPASRAEKPVTIQAEFELFRLLHRATRAYDVNTILGRKYSSRRDAILATIKLFSRTLDALPSDLKTVISSV